MADDMTLELARAPWHRCGQHYIKLANDLNRGVGMVVTDFRDVYTATLTNDMLKTQLRAALANFDVDVVEAHRMVRSAVEAGPPHALLEPRVDAVVLEVRAAIRVVIGRETTIAVSITINCPTVRAPDAPFAVHDAIREHVVEPLLFLASSSIAVLEATGMTPELLPKTRNTPDDMLCNGKATSTPLARGLLSRFRATEATEDHVEPEGPAKAHRRECVDAARPVDIARAPHDPAQEKQKKVRKALR